LYGQSDKSEIQGPKSECITTGVGARQCPNRRSDLRRVKEKADLSW